jgi:hypothetical protein
MPVQGQGVTVSNVQWRVVLATAAVMIAGACSTLGGAETNSAASPFCVEANRVAALDQAVQQASDSNPGATKDAFASLATGARELQRIAPTDLSTDYTTYLSWLDSFRDALARHDYKMGDAINDAQFVRTTADQHVADARQNVGAYLATTCHVGTAQDATTPAN